MIKRMTWFVGGAVAGVAGMNVAKRKMKKAASHLTPKNIVHTITGRVQDAVAEGRKAMRDREVELRAALEGNGRSLTTGLDDDDDDEELIDAQPVEPGQVIVLKQVRDRSSRDRRRRRA